jgi:hypothetical protein
MARKAKTIVHVNQHVIKANAKTGGRDPVITVKHGKTNTYAHEVAVIDGKEIARIVYRPDAPLSCGARVWLEVAPHGQVKLTVHEQGSESANSGRTCPV